MSALSISRLRLNGRQNRIFWTLWTGCLLLFLLVHKGMEKATGLAPLVFSLFALAAILALGIRIYGLNADRRELVRLHGYIEPDIAAFLNGEIDIAEYRSRRISKTQEASGRNPDLDKPSLRFRTSGKGDSDALWEVSCAIIRWHNRGTDGCIETLNRLWRKRPWMEDLDRLPRLTESEMFLSLEYWNLDRLVSLLHPTQKTNKTPRATAPPIIVIRWSGSDYLIDGRTRINYWKRTNDNGPHRVILIQPVSQVD